MFAHPFLLIDRLVAAAPRVVLAVTGLITALAVATLPGLHFDSSFDRFLIPDSPDLAAYRQFVDRFGNDRALVVGLDVDDPLAPATVADLHTLAGALEKISGVVRVYSLVSGPSVQGEGDEVRLAPVVSGPPPEGAAGRALLDRLDRDPVYGGRLVSRDRKMVALLVTLEPLAGEREAYRRITAETRRLLAPWGDRAHVSGEPAIESEMSDFMRRDLQVFVPITLVLTAAILFHLFRSVIGVVLPMAMIGTSTLWAIACFIVAGRSMNNVSSMIPPLIMVIAASDSVHLFSHYRGCAAHRGRRAAITDTLARIGPGCFMTSATTAVGFASLTVSSIPALNDFGRFTAIGVVFSFFLTITALPAVLHVAPVPPPPPTERLTTGATLSRWLIKAPRPVILASLGIFVAACAVIPRIRVETDDLTYFKQGSAIRTDTTILQHHFGGVRPLEIVLTGKPDAFTDPELLVRLARFTEWARGLPGIDGTTSCADLLDALFQRLDGRPLGDHSRQAIAEGYLFFELSETGGEELGRYLSDDRAVARIALQEGESRTTHIRRQIDTLSARLAHDFPELHAEITGYARFYMEISDLIVRSQVRSLALALVAITAMMAVFFRSWRVGLLSMVPNILPIACAFGVMGASGIALNSATTMVASVALGLAVDDTIHFLSHMQQERRRHPRVADALAPVLHAVEAPMVYTSVILGIGFGTLIFSRFVPSIYFGILALVTVTTALLGDLLLMPALLLAVERRAERRPEGRSRWW
jgi:predicted RND superfamily exporter protein